MIHAVLSKLSYIFVGMPMYAVFRHGPAWAGCWQGKPDEDICADLTNTDAAFWTVNEGQCSDIIHKKFNSFYVVVSAATYVYFLFTAVNVGVRVALIRWMGPSIPATSIDSAHRLK